MEFKDWLDTKYQKWTEGEKRGKSITKFAKYLGVKQQTLNNYINGDVKKPDAEFLEKLALKLGIEAYDAAGVERPDMFLWRIKTAWHGVSQKKREELANEAEADAAKHQEQRVKEN